MKIKTYPQMNETIKDLLRRSEEPMKLYILARIEDLEKQVKDLTPPPNDPLTLEELREMGLFEWLWVEVIHPTKSQLRREVESAYYQVFEDYTDGDAICCGWPGLIHDFAYEDYGKNWLAYRRKPEEEARRDA